MDEQNLNEGPQVVQTEYKQMLVQKMDKINVQNVVQQTSL